MYKRLFQITNKHRHKKKREKELLCSNNTKDKCNKRIKKKKEEKGKGNSMSTQEFHPSSGRDGLSDILKETLTL